MNEELQELATTGLSKALEYIETAESFVVEQAPLLVQEILAFGLVEATLTAVITTVVGTGIGYGTYRFCKFLVANKDEDFAFWVGMLGIGSVIGCIISTLSDCFTIAKITFAPRLYLLQELKSLL